MITVKQLIAHLNTLNPNHFVMMPDVFGFSEYSTDLIEEAIMCLNVNDPMYAGPHERESDLYEKEKQYQKVLAYIL